MRLSTHTFAGMANALTRKEPPHEDQPELMTRAERRRAARKARAVKTWKKVAAGTVAVATLFGGMGVASTALAADRDSYQDTIGNPSFESARNQYGLTKHMKNGAILHAWMWSFKTITQHMPGDCRGRLHLRADRADEQDQGSRRQWQEVHRELVLRVPAGEHLHRQFRGRH